MSRTDQESGKHIGSRHKGKDRIFQTPDFRVDVQGFRQIGGRVRSEVANTQAAVQIPADVVADAAPTVRARHVDAEQGGTAAAVHVMAPRAHACSWPGAAVQRAS